MNEQNKNEQAPQVAVPTEQAEVPAIVAPDEQLPGAPAPEFKEVPVSEPAELPAPVHEEMPVAEPVEAPVAIVKVLPAVPADQSSTASWREAGRNGRTEIASAGDSLKDGTYKIPNRPMAA